MSAFVGSHSGAERGRASTGDASGALSRRQQRTALLPLRGRWCSELEKLVHRIYLCEGSPAPRVLTIGAPHPLPGSGKMSSHVADLLASCVNARVCLVENTPGESVDETLGLPARVGWRELLGDCGLEARSAALQAAGTNLWVLSSSLARSPIPCFQQPISVGAITRRVDELRRMFDFVVIDGTADMLRLAGCSDGVAMLVQEYVTHPNAALSLKDSVEALGAAVLGVVVVQAPR